MLISEQLQEALADTGPVEISDTFRSLNSLARYNDGLWKSDRQARFLLNRISGPGYRDRAAEAWARRRGYRGQAITNIVSDKRYGRRDISKVRYYGDVFVVDNGGIVAKGKLKINQAKPKQGQYGHEVDWGGTEVEFERKKIPSIVVDIEKERRAAVEKNQPDIDMIKSIPGWEGKDILVDFVRQLEGGHALSAAQKGVVQRLMPEKDIFPGQKEDWQRLLDRYQEMMVKRLLPAMQEWWVKHEEDFQQEYDEFQKKYGGERSWGHAMPNVEKTKNQTARAIQNMKSRGYVSAGSDDISWLGSEAVYVLAFAIKKRTIASVGANSTEVIKQEVEGAIRRKTPTKRQLQILDWLARVMDRLGEASKDEMLKLVERYHAPEAREW
jgi:hypothetical protein